MIAHLPRRLSTEGAPSGAEPAAGDIAYYAPWGNLAFFYRISTYAHGLVELGHMHGEVGALRGHRSLEISVEGA